MNTTLSTTPGRHDHPPQPVDEQRSIRRVGLVDRMALHLGVALIKWGRRPRAADSREAAQRRAAQYRALVERERAAERQLRLTVPPR